MAFPLNPISIQSVAALLSSLVAFYLVGALLASRFQNPILSIGVRMALGCIAVVAISATIVSGLGTGMVFYLALLCWMLVRKGIGVDFSDLKEVGPKGVLYVLILTSAVFLLEATRSNVTDGSHVYVGNEDISYYASFAHSLYQLGIESNPENISPGIRGDVYHFGDLWFSAIYSNVFKILPYYAYSVVYRTVALVMVMMIIFGWIGQLGGKTVLSIIGCVLGVTAVYIVPFELKTDVSLLDFITCIYPLYGGFAYFSVAVVALSFSAIMFNKDYFIGSLGLMLLPFQNSGLVLATAGAALLLIGVFVTKRIMKLDHEKNELKRVIVISIAGFIAIVYFKFDGRLDDPTTDIFSLEFVYLFFHTLLRLILSQVFIIPFLVGIVYFVQRGKQGIQPLVFHTALFAGVIGSLAFIFPQIQGNSTQITSIHFTAVLAPLGIIGLCAMVSERRERKVFGLVGMVALIIIGAQATSVALSTNWYRATYNWDYMDGYREDATVKVSDWEALRSLFDQKENRVGYFSRPTEKPQGVHYNRFTYLKAVLPGTTFFRMNLHPSDTMRSAEMLGYYLRTGLGYYAKQEAFDSTRTTKRYLEFLEPDGIIVPKGDRFFMPEQLVEKYPNRVNLDEFEIYGK